MKRSKNLSKRFYSLAVSLKLRALLIRFIAFSLLFVNLFVASVVLDWENMDLLSKVRAGLILSVILPGLFVVVISPLVDIAVALLYFKSREADGESPYQIKQSYEEMEISERLKFTPRRKVLLACSLIVSMLFSGLSFVSIVPPAGAVVEPERPHIEKIPDSENAWIEYAIAIQALLDLENEALSLTKISPSSSNRSLQEFLDSKIQQIPNNAGYSKLSDVAYGFEDFNEQQLAFLDSHVDVVEHLLAGVKRPKAQYYTEAPTFISSLPNLMQTRGVCTVAIAQARRLYLQGKKNEAAELLLAAYRFGTDIAEPNSTLMSSLISVACRNDTSAAMFNWIYSGGGELETDIAIARKMAELDRRMATPYQAISWGQQSADISMQEILVKKNELYLSPDVGLRDYYSPWFKVLTAFPGLRLRFYKSYLEFNNAYQSSIRDPLENWDLNGLSKIQKDLQENWRFSMFSPGYNPNATMKALYHDRARSAVLQTFLACLAYKKMHGQFPGTLDQAMSAVGVEVPVDVATGRPIGYRLENGNPVVWLAGIDWRDDGGKDPYNLEDSYAPSQGKSG